MCIRDSRRTVEKHVVGLLVERLGGELPHELHVDALFAFKDHLHIDIAAMGLEPAVFERARLVGACVDEQRIAVDLVAPCRKGAHVVRARILDRAAHALMTDGFHVDRIDMSENHRVSSFHRAKRPPTRSASALSHPLCQKLSRGSLHIVERRGSARRRIGLREQVRLDPVSYTHLQAPFRLFACDTGPASARADRADAPHAPPRAR